MVDSPRYLYPSGDCHFPNGEKRIFHQTHIHSCAILQELLCASLEEYASADCCSANTGARTGKRATRELGKSFKDLKIHHRKKNNGCSDLQFACQRIPVEDTEPHVARRCIHQSLEKQVDVKKKVLV